MKNRLVLSVILVGIINFLSCKKEEAIPSYEPGRGRITGTTSTGYKFDVEEYYTLFSKLKATGTNGDNTDNLFFSSTLDLASGKFIQVTCGRFKGEEGEYRLSSADTELDGASYDEQNSPPVTYNLSYSAGEYSRINFTRIRGTYVEGTYVVRLGTDPYAPSVLRIEGTFQGNFRVN
jgi:hypothetical protein